jgi:hypothetical protein
MDRFDRVIDWFFSTRALAIWSFVYAAVLVADLSLEGTKNPLFIVAATVPFCILFSLLLFDLAVRTGFIRKPRETTFKLLEAVRFTFPVLVGWLALGTLALTTYSKHASQAFYETVAQVIPVMALVLAVEGRFYTAARKDWPFRWILSWMVAFLAMGLGELVSLLAIASERSRQLDLPIVGATLVTGFVAILFLARLGPIEVTEQREEGGREAG